MINCERLKENLRNIRDRIREAAGRAGRNPREIDLIPVSKGVDEQGIKQAYLLGLDCFGENRVQEAERKIPYLPGVKWHLIGPLQSNKVRKAVQIFDFIQSVDRLKILSLLAEEAVKAGKTIPVLLEVNVSGEESKHGFRPADVLPAVDRFMEQSGTGIVLSGLMTMAPLAGKSSDARYVFSGLKKLFDTVKDRFRELSSWRYISMGMSGDFETAVEEGANMVRIGSALFK
ncbi:MAG: YggS family pyridoxal phosphate-dependent enzyme [Bacillota bacterium]